MLRSMICKSCYIGMLGMVGFLLLAPQAGCMQIIRQEAPYYEKGPQQVEPPEGFFEPGTRVWVFGEKDSYMRVMSMDGRSGHVWNRDLVSVFEWDRLQRQAEQSKPKSED